MRSPEVPVSDHAALLSAAARPIRAYRSLVDWFYVALTVIGIAVHLLLLFSLRTELLNPLFNDSMHRFGPGCDFFSIYAAGVKARLGESIFTIGGHVETVPYAYAFRYAPAVAYTLGWGLSYLPALTAYGAWLVLCELTLLRNIRLIVELAASRAEVPERFRVGCLVAALWLLFSPYYLELYVGQFTFVAASLVFWGYLGWGRSGIQAFRHSGGGRWASGIRVWERQAADLFWAGAVWLKLMPLLYMPLALLRGRWKGVLATGAVLVGSSWLYFARFPADWAVFTATNGHPQPTWHAGNQGLMALLFALAGERTAPFLAARTAVLAVVGAVLLWLFYQAWREERRAESRRQEAEGGKQDVGEGQAAEVILRPALLTLYAALSAAYLLIYKDVWEHHYVVVLPPLVLLALAQFLRVPGAPTAWTWLPPFVIAALPTLFALYDLPALGYNEDPQRYWTAAVSLLHHAWKPVAPLWLFGALFVRSLVPVVLTQGEPSPPRPAAAGPVRWGMGLAAVALGATLLPAGWSWASEAIREQRRTSGSLVWPETVFRRQARPENCGPAALAAVSRHFGRPTGEEECAQLAGTNRRGTSMRGLRDAALKLGLAAEGRQVEIQDLARLPKPAILFFHQGHFAVLTGTQGDRFYLADPSLGQRCWSAAELTRRWRGELLLIGPGTPGVTPSATGTPAPG